jgi:type I restriction enzyme S subunit
MTSNLKNVPPNWQKVRFDEIAEIVTDRIEKPIESGLSDYIGLEHLDTDCIRIKRFGSTADVDATKFLCKKGDIIFGKRRAYLRKLAVSDRDAVVSAHSMVLRPTGNKIYPDFLPCFMQSSIFWKTAHSISEGSMSPTIKWKTLAAQEFLLPSIEEQKKISELLWSIEDNIQKTEKLIETTETLKQGLLNELLTKGIGHTRFKDSELGRIPEEWEVVKLEKLIQKKYILSHLDGNHGSKYPRSKEFVEEGVPYISANTIIEGAVDFSKAKYLTLEKAKEFTKGVAKQGDVLLAHNATVGPTAILETSYPFVILGTSLTYYRCNQDLVSNIYLLYYMRSSVFQNQLTQLMKQTTRNQVPITSQRKLYFVIPPISEQKQIAGLLEYAEKCIRTHKMNADNLNKLKNKLTNELLLGRVKV